MTARAFLLVDAGNTAVKSALIASQDISRSFLENFSRLLNGDISSESLCQQWSRMANELKVNSQEVDLVWVCVGPAQAKRSIEMAFAAWAKKPATSPQSAGFEFVLPASGRVLRNAYEEPAKLGADRWVSALGMASSVSESELGAHLIISAGTATTIDLIKVCREADNLAVEFSGGWILPGVAMMQTALRTGTAGLGVMPKLDVKDPWAAPRNSSDAIGQGIALAQSGFIDLLAQAFEVKQLWLHGGAAEQWKSCLEITGPGKALAQKIRIDPALAFEGLACIAALR